MKYVDFAFLDINPLVKGHTLVVPKQEIDYIYDLSGFFEAFPFINASKFAKEIGMNESVMRKYKGKIVTASDKQRALIQERYNNLLRRMEAVRF